MSLRLVNSLVHPLIVLDSLAEVLRRVLRILTNIIWGCCLDFKDIRHDEVFVVAFALNEEVKEFRADEFLEDPCSACLCRICRIKDRYLVALVSEPFEHVCYSSF